MTDAADDAENQELARLLDTDVDETATVMEQAAMTLASLFTARNAEPEDRHPDDTEAEAARHLLVAAIRFGNAVNERSTYEELSRGFYVREDFDAYYKTVTERLRKDLP